MNEIEKRELIEQRRKIFEAGTQRADKRTGSFSFLTWPFFIAPLIAGEEFLAATFKSAAAKEQDAKALQAGAAPRAANDDPPVSDPSKANAENETTKGPAASSDAHAAQLDLNGLPAQSDEDAPKLSAAHSEAVVAASDESGGGGGDVAESRHHDAHTSIDDSSVNSLLADSHFGSGQLQGGSTVEALHSNGLADLFNPSIGGSAPLLGTVGGPSNDVVGGIAPVEAAVPPVLTTVTHTMGTLTHDVVGAIAPVGAAVPPVLTTVTHTMGTLTHDVAGTLAPVEAAVPPGLTTVGDTVGTLTHDVAGTLAPVEAAVPPVLTTVTDTIGTLTHDVAGTLAPVEAAVPPVLTTVTDTMGTLTHDVAGTLAPVEAAVPPVLTTVTDTMGTLTHDVAGTLAPVEAAVPPVLTTVTDTVGTLTHDVVGTLAPVEAAAVQPVLTHVTDTVSAPTHDVLHPADTGKVSETLASAVPVGDTTEPVLASAGVSHSNPTTDLLHPAVADTGAGQAAGPADTLLALATATDAPIELPGSATAAPANVATGASNAAATVHPTAIAGDVIALNDAPAPPAHALFTGSQYTDYGVTLSSDIAVPPQHAVSPADTTSAHDTLVPVVADAQKHAPPPPDIVDTTHSIDHLGHAML